MAADRVTAKNSDAKFKAHDEGQFVAQAVDCIDMGETVVEFPGTPSYLAQKCALVFRTGELNSETGERIDVSSEFTVSLGEKANLRKFLESWRGKAYTAEQIDAGVPLDKLVGNWALLSIGHKTSKKGRTYAVIVSAVPVPKQMRENLVSYTDYERAKYWDEKKAEYAKGAKAYRQEIGAAQNGTTEDDMPTDTTDYSDDAEIDSDTSLPF